MFISETTVVCYYFLILLIQQLQLQSTNQKNNGVNFGVLFNDKHQSYNFIAIL